MSDEYTDLKERVERLERIVDDLRSQRSTAPAATTPPTASQPPFAAATQHVAVKKVPVARRPIRIKGDLQSWLRFIGIGLLLFGVVFLFKYSEEETTLLRILRVGVAVVLGTGLVVAGRLLLGRDRAFAQVLTGGGIGIWYISGFASYQLFGLVPAAVAFTFMALVTVLAFVISVRQDSLAMAIVATLGGLATPFLLYDVDRSVLGVVSYVVLVTTGAVAICVNRRWRALLWVAVVASGLALVGAMAQYVGRHSTTAPRWYVEAGLLYLWLLFGIVSAWAAVRIPHKKTPAGDDDLLVLIPTIPLAAIWATATVWRMDHDRVGYVCLIAALVYAAVALRLYLVPLIRLMSAHFVAAAGLLAVGALLVLGGSAQHLAIATEALAVRVLARRAGLHVANVASHGLFIIVGLLLMRDFIDVPNPTVPVFNSGGITMLWSIVSIAGAAFVMPHTSVRRFYLYSAHTLILFWILHQFSHISSGQAAVSVIWGLYGASVLIVGLRRGIRQVRTTGLVTLLAVVAKLFLVDLESVRAIWRVLLFIGFGGVFLALSYWFLSLDRSRKHEESDVSKT